MPAFLEQKLRREYAAKGKTGKALDHAVYGTMNNVGAMYGNKETAKGRRMQAKHDAKTKQRSKTPKTLGALYDDSRDRPRTMA